MKPAEYAVVRFVADPARNEPVNIGIVVWNDLTSSFRLDESSIFRVIRDNPHLSKDSLDYLPSFLESSLRSTNDDSMPSAIKRYISEHRHFPIVFTEARATAVEDWSEGALEVALDRLVERVVHPPKPSRGGRTKSAEDVLAKRWKPWIGSQIKRNHIFRRSRSGNQRSVDFYANSNVNIAIDVLRLAVKHSDEIIQRADAEAFKIEDIINVPDRDVAFIVYCEMKSQEEYIGVNEIALRSLESVGATVMTDVEDLGQSLESKLSLV